MPIPTLPASGSTSWYAHYQALDAEVRVTAPTAWARAPENLITGSIVRNLYDVITSAAVTWPDGTTGTYTALTFSAEGAVNSYQVTYGTNVTYTQPPVTRDSQGVVTAVPPIVRTET